MSQRGRKRVAARRRAPAPLFAALGDETRLLLIAKLSGGDARSISQLTVGSGVTRQAITKHLHVLKSAGIVRGVHRGRESRFEFNPRPLEELRKYLDQVCEHWDEALGRLKSYVEE